jgi:hypothetical protein
MTQEPKKRHNQMTAQELLVVSETATTHEATQKVVDEFARRHANASERTMSKNGKPLSEEFIAGRVAKIQKNLDTATKYMNTFTKPKVVIPSTFVANPLGFSKTDMANLTKLLAKLQS